MRINYLDLFSGIGGFSEGIRQALSDTRRWNEFEVLINKEELWKCLKCWIGLIVRNV